MKLEKLSDVNENLELWRGSKIRLLNNGIDMHPDDKYFDYLLATAPWEKDHILLVNITEESQKRGAIYANKIAINKSHQKCIATKASLKEALGEDFEHCYLIVES